MKTNFLSICIGIAIVLFSLGFLIRSINPAQAAPNPEKFIQQGTDKIGKYMMTIGFNTNGSAIECIVWDTETAKSSYYLYNSTKNWYKLEAKFQLPEKPME